MSSSNLVLTRMNYSGSCDGASWTLPFKIRSHAKCLHFCELNMETRKSLRVVSLPSSSSLSLNPVSFNLETYGSRAFAVSAPEIWNKLPSCDIRSCENLSLFKHKLKTYLLKNYNFGR